MSIEWSDFLLILMRTLRRSVSVELTVPTEVESPYTEVVPQNADQAVHKAARDGLVEKVAAMLATDSSLIDAKGIDARTPLHCAGTVTVAALLLDHGARIDAREEDHNSTPAQWLIGESPEVAQCGSRTRGEVLLGDEHELRCLKLMLDLGFPVAHPERSHGYTPLHNAAWAGSGDLVDLLIARGHPVDFRDPRFDATPLGYALHDCLVENRHPEGEFPRVVKALVDAGSPLTGVKYPTGHVAVDEVLGRYF